MSGFFSRALRLIRPLRTITDNPFLHHAFRFLPLRLRRFSVVVTPVPLWRRVACAFLVVLLFLESPGWVVGLGLLGDGGF